MSILQKIKRGGQEPPPRVVLCGPIGIGKTTFGSEAPTPLFISSEDGLYGFANVERFTPETFQDVLDLIDGLIGEAKIAFQTIVIDSADWLERLIHSHICTRDAKANVESYGYGKGYEIACGELVGLLAKLDALRHKHKVGIIFLSHIHIRTFNDPAGESWDRYEAKGNKKFAGLLMEWPDAVLFAVFEVFKTKASDGSKDKTIGGERIVHTQWSPAWDAKNRLNLPPTLPLSYQSFVDATKENAPDEIGKLREQFRGLIEAADMTDEERAKWLKSLPTATADRIKAGIKKLTK